MKAEHYQRLFAEGILIVFSVLFALFINQMAEDRKVDRRKQIALSSIQKEMKKNQTTVKRWVEHHRSILERTDSLVNGLKPELYQKLTSREYLQIDLLLNYEPIVDEFLSNTAWETAKSTDIIQEFDYQTVQVLTEAYLLQEMMMEKTLIKVVDLYFDRRTQRTENLDDTLIQLRLTIRELYGQESLLFDLYSTALKTLSKS